MPDYFQSSNPWLGAAQAGRGLGDTIQSALLQVPKAQAEGRMMQQEFLMNQLKMQQEQQMQPFQTGLLRSEAGANDARGKASLAEAGSYDAQAALTRAKTGQLTQQDQLHVKMGQDMGKFVQESLTTGQVSPETAGTLAQSLAALNKLDPQLMPSILKEIGVSASGVGTDKGLAASAMTGYKVPDRTTLAPGATSFETMNPQAPVFTAPGRPVDEAKNDAAEFTKIFTSIQSAHTDMSIPEVAAQTRRVLASRTQQGAFHAPDSTQGSMPGAASPSVVASPGRAPTNAPTSFKQGDRVIQNGVTYEFNGQEMVPVTQ